MGNKEHNLSMEALTKEAERLVNLQIRLRKELLENKEIPLEDTGNEHAFSRDVVTKQIEVLRGEATKLAQREAVLVIVGTMKAGKSTLINAIIGTEALPTRNRPMTILPTLIRHKPGQFDPVLEFSNRKPLDKLVKELQAQAKMNRKKLKKRRRRDKHFDDLVSSVEEGRGFCLKYRGANEIAEFLRDLNDLARLAGELKVEFPFEDYNEIHEVPVVEVEFAHLQETEESTGRLALLDTPGPNEFRQDEELRRLLKDQLKKATAVLAVLDYTQLQSDADADIRNELKTIKDIMTGRAYALVNKIDERDAHSDDAKQVRSLVVEDLMPGMVSESAVFPASARLAYLANRAKHGLQPAGCLPDPKEEPWVEDFGKEAFGGLWQEQIDNNEKVIEAADKLWESSQLSPLLERVIGTAHANAALLAMDSITSKLDDQSERLRKNLHIRSISLKREIADIEGKAENLQKDIGELEKNKKEAEKQKDALLADLDGSIKAEVDKVSGEAKIKVEIYFQEDFDPEKPTIRFKSKKAARQCIDKISESVSKIVNDAEHILQEKIGLQIDDFERKFEDAQRDRSKAVVVKMQERLGKDGFKIKIKLPRIRSPHRQLKLEDTFIRSATRTRIRKVEQEGMLGKIKRVVGWIVSQDDWGKYEIESKTTSYHVNVLSVKGRILEVLSNHFLDLNKETVPELRKVVEGSVEQFFDELKAKVEEIRQDFLHSKRDLELSNEKQKKLHRVLTDYLKKADFAEQDCDGLRRDVVLAAKGERYAVAYTNRSEEDEQ